MKKLKADWEYLGIKSAKEIPLFALGTMVFLLIGVALYFWKGFGILLAFPGLGLLIYAFYFFSRYGALRKAKLERLNAEFVEIFTYFGVFINDGFTVYNALERVKAYAGEEMGRYIEELLQDIDEDKSVAPFVRFAARFDDVAVKEVLLSVYQMVDEGSGGVYIRQFQRLFGKLSDTRYALDKERRLSRLDTLAFLPLAGAGIAILSLTLSIMEIMGDMLNVL